MANRLAFVFFSDPRQLTTVEENSYKNFTKIVRFSNKTQEGRFCFIVSLIPLNQNGHLCLLQIQKHPVTYKVNE